MKPTEDMLAAELFADVLLPLAYANRRRGVAYLDRGPRRQTYWTGIVSRTGGLQRLSGSACDGTAVLALLGEYWERTNPLNLSKLLPSLEELRKQLTAGTPSSDPEQPRLTEFVYPLF